jgi:hypothetical protein
MENTSLSPALTRVVSTAGAIVSFQEGAVVYIGSGAHLASFRHALLRFERLSASRTGASI